MKKYTFLYTLLFLAQLSFAQESVYPAKKQEKPVFISNGTIHVGNGTVINNGSVEISDGKISNIGSGITPSSNAVVIDAKGKHVYPGLILSNSNLGLVEVNSVRATADAVEIGEFNSNIKSLVAYNTDSKVINTLKTNGVVLANVVPQGGIISGSSSVVQIGRAHV